MYRETKANARNGHESETFVYNIGIRQGCNLSCLLFALYLNDLESIMHSQNCKGVSINDPLTNNTMIKLLLLRMLIIQPYLKKTKEAFNVP